MGFNRAKLGNKKYKQGHYILQNVDKYIGNTPVLYRSSWEFAFCKFCDLNDKVKKWSAEGLEIPYQITNKKMIVETHRYYPDFYVEMTTNDPERYDRVLIEIKPKREISPPVAPTKHTLKMLENYEYSLMTYKKNLHKWAFAKEWCDKRHIKFIIISEDDLKKSGLIR